MRDLATHLPAAGAPSDVIAYLPLMVERCRHDGQWVHIVGGVNEDLAHPTFGAGGAVLYWNGAPIAWAVDMRRRDMQAVIPRRASRGG